MVYIDARDGWSQLDEDTMKIVKRLTPAGFDPATDILTNEKSVEAFLDIPAGPRGLEGHLNMLAIDKLRAPSTGTQYKSSDNRVDMDDLRIRPWSWDDSRQHNQYIMHGVQIDLARRAREVRSSPTSHNAEMLICSGGAHAANTTTIWARGAGSCHH